MVSTAAAARTAMKTNHFDEAIRLFEHQLAEHPDDLNSLLHLGICHLLSRSERTFLSIYRKAVLLKDSLETVPHEVLRTFSLYENLLKKVTASALILGTVATVAPSCTSVYFASPYDAGFTTDSPDAAVADTETDQ